MVESFPSFRSGITVLIGLVGEVHDLMSVTEMFLQKSMLYFLVDKLTRRVSMFQASSPMELSGLLTLS